MTTVPELVLAAHERFREPLLSALLVAQLALIFIAGPLSVMGFNLPSALAMAATLVLILMVASRHSGALIVAAIAVGVRILTEIFAIERATLTMDAIDSASTVVALVALGWVVSGVVFEAGRITMHRILGAVALYLAIAMAFAWIYRIIAVSNPGAFSGLHLRAGGVFTIAPFNYFSLAALTTLVFGDITPVDPLARSLATLEAMIGQLYPALVLGRILTLYSGEKERKI
jgi:hypothetical protein